MPAYPVQYINFPILPSHAFPSGRTARRPIIRLDLISGANRLACYAMVDSGADLCTFPSSFLPSLGLNPQTGAWDFSSGLGSQNIPTCYWSIEIDLQGVIRYPCFVGFTDGLNDWGIGLLGQTGFFDRFKVRFDLQGGIFEIET